MLRQKEEDGALDASCRPPDSSSPLVMVIPTPSLYPPPHNLFSSSNPSKLRLHLPLLDNQRPQPPDPLLCLPLHPAQQLLAARDVGNESNRDARGPDAGVGVAGGVDDFGGWRGRWVKNRGKEEASMRGNQEKGLASERYEMGSGRGEEGAYVCLGRLWDEEKRKGRSGSTTKDGTKKETRPTSNQLPEILELGSSRATFESDDYEVDQEKSQLAASSRQATRTKTRKKTNPPSRPCSCTLERYCLVFGRLPAVDSGSVSKGFGATRRNPSRRGRTVDRIRLRRLDHDVFDILMYLRLLGTHEPGAHVDSLIAKAKKNGEANESVFRRRPAGGKNGGHTAAPRERAARRPLCSNRKIETDD